MPNNNNDNNTEIIVDAKEKIPMTKSWKCYSEISTSIFHI